ncbi:hypothetical protein C8Q74DRAFT_1217029 [Fomes fomentarius]|nr:hypothetical protein C8Q74DRAFT_1217029 [Fomes fomentarius]
MPLFHSSSRSNDSVPPPPPAQTNHRSRGGGLFGRRSDSPEQYDRRNGNGAPSTRSSPSHSSGGGGFFSRRRSSSSSRSPDLKHDPSILAARQKVADAEAAESAADRALNEARVAVRGAKEQVKMLEQEVLEEARRAKVKQNEAKTIKKNTGRLGRHG